MASPRPERLIPTQVTGQKILTDLTACKVNKLDAKAIKKSPFHDREPKAYVGKWFTFLPANDPDDNGMTTLDKAWYKLLDNHEQDPGVFKSIMVTTSEKPSDCIIHPSMQAKQMGVVMCFTKDFRIRQDVFSAGNTLREILNKELAGKRFFYLPGFTEFCGKTRCIIKCSPSFVLYEQTPNGHFATRASGSNILPPAPIIPEGKERLIPMKVTDVEFVTGRSAYEADTDSENSNADSSEENDPEQDATAGQRRDASKLPESNSESQNSEVEESSSDDEQNEDISREYSTSGKWLVFLANNDPDKEGLTTLDKAWFKVLDAWEKEYTIFSSIMVTTAMKEEKDFYPGSDRHRIGVVLCFTKNYRNLRDVRRAATVLRQILPEETFMKIYYKTDNAAYALHYRALGDRGISLYRHCPDGAFSIRIGEFNWERLIMGNVTEQKLIPSQASDKPFLTEKSAFGLVEEKFDYTKISEDIPEDGVIQRRTEEYPGPSRREASATFELVKSMFGGYWKAYLPMGKRNADGLTLLDQAWFKLLEYKQLNPAKLGTVLVSTTMLINPPDRERFGIVCCSTKNYRDMVDVKRTAGLLRDILGDLVVNDEIYYYAMDYHLYKHDPDWSFWRREYDGGWERKYADIYHNSTSM